jgi:glyceraldehyde 3-phosphate dehydrogenase
MNDAGRNVLRASLSRPEIAVVAKNHTCISARDLVHLLRYDSTLGPLPSAVDIVLKNESLLLIDGHHHISLISE